MATSQFGTYRRGPWCLFPAGPGAWTITATHLPALRHTFEASSPEQAIEVLRLIAEDQRRSA